MRPSPKTRNAIVAAAMRLFHEKGYAATTMEAVAEAAGVAKGSIYNYFRNKQDLYRQVFTASLSEDDTRAQAVSALPASPTERLGRIFDLWLERLPYYRQIGGLLLEFWATAAHESRQGEFKAILNDIYARHRRPMLKILEEGIAAGEFRPQIGAEQAAALLFAVTDGLTVRAVLDPDFTVTTEMLDTLKRGALVALTRAPLSDAADSSSDRAEPPVECSP